MANPEWLWWAVAIGAVLVGVAFVIVAGPVVGGGLTLLQYAGVFTMGATIGAAVGFGVGKGILGLGLGGGPVGSGIGVGSAPPGPVHQIRVGSTEDTLTVRVLDAKGSEVSSIEIPKRDHMMNTALMRERIEGMTEMLGAGSERHAVVLSDESVPVALLEQVLEEFRMAGVKVERAAQ